MNKSIKCHFGFICCLAILFVFFSCVNKSQKVTLLIDTENSIIVDSLFVYDSIVVEKRLDTITFAKYSNNGRPFVNKLCKYDGDFYEIRELPELMGSVISMRTDTLITLSKKDTSVINPYERVYLAVWGLQYGSMNYKFTKESNIYKTVKQSLQDSTYFEIFYYNDKYQISKFINTWRNNKIVYIPHNE